MLQVSMYTSKFACMEYGWSQQMVKQTMNPKLKIKLAIIYIRGRGCGKNKASAYLNQCNKYSQHTHTYIQLCIQRIQTHSNGHQRTLTSTMRKCDSIKRSISKPPAAGTKRQGTNQPNGDYNDGETEKHSPIQIRKNWEKQITYVIAIHNKLLSGFC